MKVYTTEVLFPSNMNSRYSHIVSLITNEEQTGWLVAYLTLRSHPMGLFMTSQTQADCQAQVPTACQAQTPSARHRCRLPDKYNTDTDCQTQTQGLQDSDRHRLLDTNPNADCQTQAQTDLPDTGTDTSCQTQTWIQLAMHKGC